MSKRITTIPRAPCVRILQNQGAKRVSAEAADEFAKILEEIAIRISIKAKDIVTNSNRKTIKSGDIKLASK